MQTLQDAIRALERRTGFEPGSVRAAANRLVEDGILPRGTPGRHTELTVKEFIDLLIARAASPTHRQGPETVKLFDELVRDGIDVSVMPPDIRPPRRTARAYLQDLALDALDDDPQRQRTVSQLTLEFVESWPELAIHLDGKTIGRFREPGALASHWQTPGHRRSTTIAGAAFVDAVRDVFAGAK